MRLLLLEADKVFGEAVTNQLRVARYHVDWSQRLDDLVAEANMPYDMLLVSADLPDGSGLDWIRALRAADLTLPILYIAAEDRPDEKVDAIKAGADNCIVKPFSPEQLLDRLRRAELRKVAQSPARLQLGDVELDLTLKVAYRAGEPVNLTQREWNLVQALASHSSQIVPKCDLEALVHGPGALLASNALEVHLWSVRRKLGRDLIRTVRGIGYRLRD